MKLRLLFLIFFTFNTAVAMAQTPEATPPTDPCAVYKSQRSIMICRDRIMKIERMKAAKQKRSAYRAPKIEEPEVAPDAVDAVDVDVADTEKAEKIVGDTPDTIDGKKEIIEDITEEVQPKTDTDTDASADEKPETAPKNSEN